MTCIMVVSLQSRLYSCCHLPVLSGYFIGFPTSNYCTFYSFQPRSALVLTYFVLFSVDKCSFCCSCKTFLLLDLTCLDLLFLSIVSYLAVKPLEVSIIAPKRSLSAGVRSEVVCRSSGTRPPTLMSWYRDSKRITSASTLTSTSSTLGEDLSLVPASVSPSKQQQMQQKQSNRSLLFLFPSSPSSAAASTASSYLSPTKYTIRETQSPDGNVFLSSLSFVAGPEDDGSSISCRVHDNRFPEVPIEKSIELSVHCKFLSRYSF